MTVLSVVVVVVVARSVAVGVVTATSVSVTVGEDEPVHAANTDTTAATTLARKRILSDVLRCR